MDKKIKNEEVNEEIVDKTAEETENTAGKETECKEDSKDNEKKELTPDEKIAEL